LQDDVVIGTVLAGYDGIRGWIYHLAVRSSKRRAGIARRLMMAAEDQLIALGCPKVNLQVRSTNADVVAFYKEIGYEIEDRISMGKRLVTTVKEQIR
jgi:ribosomal protein S18 acetylase RimI-like enzyme